MYKRSKSVPHVKVPVWLLTSCLVGIGELSLRENWSLLSPRAVHSYYSVLAKAIIKNGNSIGDMMSTCLKPTLNSKHFSTLS